MKKVLISILIAMMSVFTLTSCVTTVEAQDGVYTTAVIDVDDIEMAIVYGTPYIVNGVVLYYLYNNLYYYPYYSRGYYYYHVYARPLARYPHHWRPVARNHWFRDGHYHNPHGFAGRGGHRPKDRHVGGRPHNDRRIGVTPDRKPNPSAGHNNGRPNDNRTRQGMESSTRQTAPNNRVFGNGTAPNRSVTTPNRSVTPPTRSTSTPNRVFGGSRPSSPSIGGSARPSAPSRSTGGGHFGGRR